MQAEHAVSRRVLDTSIFAKSSFSQEGDNDQIFGEVGRIVRSGDIYSLNRGFNIHSGSYELVVLDVLEKKLNIYYFRGNISQDSWETIKTDIAPQSDSKADYIYLQVRQFALKIEEYFAGSEDKLEVAMVKSALKRAAKPLRKYFSRARSQMGTMIKELSF